jgi:flagellar hook-associated protein 1 FlgK
MRSTFLGLETARKGLVANQKGLDVTGQNITNVNTEGYTRQRIDTVSVSSVTNSNIKPLGTSAVGQGVLVTGVSQIRDKQLDLRFRSEMSETAYYDKTLAILDGVETVLNEIGNGIQPVLSGFMSSLQDLSLYPDQVTNANIVLSNAKSMTQIIRHYSSQLDQLKTQYNTDLMIDVDNTNTLIKKITELNTAIKNEIGQSTSAHDTSNVNELLDKRNSLLDELSQYGNISTHDNPDGSIDVSFNEHVIISNQFSEQVNLLTNPDGSNRLVWQSTGNDVILESGTLKASLDFINSDGGAINGIPYYQKQLDLFATRFAEILNTAFAETDDTLKTLIDIDSNNPAHSITINETWLNKASYLIDNLKVNGSLDNTPILSIIAKLEGKNTLGTYVGSLSDFVTSYVTTLGQDMSYYESRYEVSLSITEDIQNRRDSVSSVSLDEEGANLMLYDKAYKAVSRLMTAMDEFLDVIINKTGMVGR